MINNKLFLEARALTSYNEKKDNKIGTLREKTVHAVLKNYLEPRQELHEKRIGAYYADIARELSTDKIEIIEVQTRNFNALRKKLDYFLELGTVTIVYPIPDKKWIQWIDEETGEITKKRKSPKQGSFFMIFPELYKIKNYLKHPNLKLQVFLIDMEEFRLLNGWSENRKKGSTRYDRIPIGLNKELVINSEKDYKFFIPDELPNEFTSKEFQKVSKLTMSKAQTTLNILNYMEVVERIGKKGNSYIYQRNFT